MRKPKKTRFVERTKGWNGGKPDYSKWGPRTGIAFGKHRSQSPLNVVELHCDLPSAADTLVANLTKLSRWKADWSENPQVNQCAIGLARRVLGRPRPPRKEDTNEPPS